MPLYHVLVPIRATQVYAIQADTKADAAAEVGAGDGQLIETRVGHRTTKPSGYTVIEPGRSRRQRNRRKRLR